MIESSTCREAPSLVVDGTSERTRFRQVWQNDLRGFRMCIMVTISTRSVVILESLNGLLLAHLRQDNTSKFGGLTCLSSLRGKSPARILSGKYLSDKQAKRNMPARLCEVISALQFAPHKHHKVIMRYFDSKILAKLPFNWN
jgi:hypothetical protein